MKNIITILLSVLLSVLAVWYLLPSMEQYYAQKGEAKEKTEEVKKIKEAPEKTIVHETEFGHPKLKIGITQSGSLFIKYTIHNNSSNPIKNVKLRFIYFDSKGKQIHYEESTRYCTLAPRLTQSFEHVRPSEVPDRYGLKIEVLDYNFKRL